MRGRRAKSSQFVRNSLAKIWKAYARSMRRVSFRWNAFRRRRFYRLHPKVARQNWATSYQMKHASLPWNTMRTGRWKRLSVRGSFRNMSTRASPRRKMFRRSIFKRHRFQALRNSVQMKRIIPNSLKRRASASPSISRPRTRVAIVFSRLMTSRAALKLRGSSLSRRRIASLPNVKRTIENLPRPNAIKAHG